MTRSKEEIARINAEAQRFRDNAQQMPAEDAARLRAKWSRDAQSMTADMIEEKE
jgi:hypothetical protein